MKQGSIRFRLITLWVGILVVVLAISTYGLQVLFERSILRRTLAELSLDLKLLSEAIDIDAKGLPTLTAAPRDPLFQVVYGGRYWQVMQGTQPVFRSPSLWGDTLSINVSGIGPAELLPVRLTGPQDQNLFGVARQVSGKTRPDEPQITVLVAADFDEVELAKQRFADDLIIGASLIGLILMIATFSHVVIGLRPLRDLQARLTSVRQGESRRLEGTFPLEVMPLVIETNALLDAQDAALGLARTRAADLAHGLKTPLAVMTAQSRNLRRRGEAAIADQLDVQMESMRRHVEREIGQGSVARCGADASRQG